MKGHSHDHDQGLEHDLKRLTGRMDRRQLLRWMAGATVGATLLPLLGCNSGNTSGSTSGGTSSGTGDPECAIIPEETQGPYPGDGSNGVNALLLSGIVRSDIRSSIATASGTAEGIPLTVTLTLVNSNNSCEPLGGYALYLWHCNRDGKYSLYDVTDQNYLRGVQQTASDGTVSFTTIFPACYSGRMPHIHFEVYPSLAKATSSANKLKTSQLALPEDICEAVYATTGYSASVANLASTSFAKDNVFSDGTSLQMASVTGSTSAGYVATLQVGISA